MTSSILSHLSGDLHPNDLQTVRDFALEAPWEWRKALEALCDDSETLANIGITEAEARELQEKVGELEGELELEKEKNERAEADLKALEALKKAAEEMLEAKGEALKKARANLQEALDDC